MYRDSIFPADKRGRCLLLELQTVPPSVHYTHRGQDNALTSSKDYTDDAYIIVRSHKI
jgi:hypothetical protein